jgi:hypothetical protein
MFVSFMVIRLMIQEQVLKLLLVTSVFQKVFVHCTDITTYQIKQRRLKLFWKIMTLLCI